MTKQNNILVLALCSLFFIQGQAQTSALSIGVRGGGQMFLTSAASGATGEVKSGIGGTGGIDLRYTFYGCLNDRIGLGFAVGAGVGYGSTGIKGTNTDSYVNTDYLGNRMDYTVQSTFSQADRFTKAEASLLAAFCFGNVILNVGPRFMLPFMPSSSITIESASIDAYYPAYNVHITNQLITGKLETPYWQVVSSSLPSYNVLMALEIGYEWYLNDNSCLGIQAFADIAVWGKQSPVTKTPLPLISVASITNASDPVPHITVNAPDWITNRRYLDFGIRAYYSFSFRSKSNKHRYMPARDSKDHRNRYRWY